MMLPRLITYITHGGIFGGRKHALEASTYFIKKRQDNRVNQDQTLCPKCKTHVETLEHFVTCDTYVEQLPQNMKQESIAWLFSVKRTDFQRRLVHRFIKSRWGDRSKQIEKNSGP